jgi:hypothetical protein
MARQVDNYLLFWKHQQGPSEQTKNLNQYILIQQSNGGEKMNHKRVSTIGTILVLIAIVLAGCAAAKADPCPTVEPLSCPTTATCPEPQACPTSAALSMPPADKSSWQWTQLANVIITYNPGDQCTVEVINQPESSGITYEIVVNDQAYKDYVVLVETLDEGKTLQDLVEARKTYGSEQPPFTQVQFTDAVYPMTRTWHGITYNGRPLYFTCMVEGSFGQKIIGQNGPVTIPDK